jgi:hypothetical protein
MEFRVFLPRLLPSEDPSSSILLSKYDHALQSLIAAFGGEDNRPQPENREDLYLVGGVHFGVKFRSGKKLEVKIRRKKLDLNIEHWKKVKLGKKSIAFYKNEILGLIAAEADHQLPEDASLIDSETFVAVQKVRMMQLTGEVSKEICFISSPETTRLWVSIAIEGSLEDIQGFLRSNSNPDSDVGRILEALHIAKEIAKIGTLISPENPTFLPVVAGYPTWVRLCSQSTCTSKEKNTILSEVELLLTNLRPAFLSSIDINGVATPEKKAPVQSAAADREICFKFC